MTKKESKKMKSPSSGFEPLVKPVLSICEPPEKSHKKAAR